MKLNDIINMSLEDYMRMDEAALRDAVRSGAAVANRRLRAIEKSNYSVVSPAYYSVAHQQGGRPKYTSAGKNFNQLRAELASIRNFLTSKTGTVAGARDYSDYLRERYDIKSDGELKQLFDVYNRLVELSPNIEISGDSDRVQQEIREVMAENPGASDASIIEKMEERLGIVESERAETEAEYESFEDSELWSDDYF